MSWMIATPRSVDLALFLSGLCLVMLAAAMTGSRARRGHDAWLRRRIDLLLDHFGIDPDAEVREEVMPLLRRNRRIPAMRLYRRRTGADLETARMVVERWMVQVAREMADACPGSD